jgi:hypothetical protein
MTSLPNSARQTPTVKPTYPLPKTVIFILEEGRKLFKKVVEN